LFAQTRGLEPERKFAEKMRHPRARIATADIGNPLMRHRSVNQRVVPHAAGVIGDPPVSAVGAGLGVAAERSVAAMFDSRHDLELVEAQMPGMGGPVRRTGSAKDVGDLE
jgi:hypothetical protein